MTKLRLVAEWALLLLAAAALVFAAQQRGLVERLDLWLLDMASWGKAAEPNPDIVIVEIDDRSLARIGNWPWQRDAHAELIDQLSRAGPRVIAADILFLDPADPNHDQALAQSIRSAGNVVLPHTFGPLIGTSSSVTAVMPINPLLQAARGVGHVAVEADADGVIRRFELSRDIAGTKFPHFAASVVEIGGEAGTSFPLSANAPAIIPYNRAGSFPSASASDVVAGEVPREFFRDKIVLIGATAQGLGDRYSVPDYAGRLMSGVENQANLLSAIYDDKLIRELPAAWALAIQFSALVLLFIAFWKLSPRAALIASIGLMAALVVISIMMLRIWGVWFATGPALLAIVIAYPLWGWRRLASVSRFLETEARALSVDGTTSRRPAGEGFDVVARQVSLLKNLTSEVSRNLQLVQDVLDASPDAMLVTGGDGQIVMANSRAEELFDFADEELRRDFPGLVVDIGAEYDEISHELSCADGSSFLLAKAPIDPSIGSEVLVLRDITRIKDDERQRRETLEFLSHDMRSPQVAIIGLSGSAGNSLDPAARLGRIEDQARRTLKLTDDFVQIARLETEGVTKQEAELNSILHEASDRAFALAHRKKIQIVTQENEEPVFADVDPSAIGRALDNLLSNAIKFSPDGAKVEIALDTSRDGQVAFSVADQGPGLPVERRNDPYARFGAKSDEGGPSSGLGLAFVKQVVDKHGGSIAVRSDAASGTHIEFVLPYS